MRTIELVIQSPLPHSQELLVPLTEFEQYSKLGWQATDAFCYSHELAHFLIQDVELVTPSTTDYPALCALQCLPEDILQAVFDLRELTGNRDFWALLETHIFDRAKQLDLARVRNNGIAPTDV